MRRLASYFFLITTCGLAGCTSQTKTLYKRGDISMEILRANFLDKKFAVRMQFYVSKAEIYEETGYLKSSSTPGYVIFEYYDNSEHSYRDLDVPLQNISSIEVASQDSRRFSTTQKLAFGAAIGSVLLFFIGMSIQ